MPFHFFRPMAALAIGAAALAGPAQAGPFSDLVIFGDSLSDTGNVLSLTQAFTSNPFPVFPGAEGRFSNGPVWTELLAAGLGLPSAAAPANLLLVGPPLAPSLQVIPTGVQGGHNFAYGGARTGLGGSAGATTGLLGQLAAWNGNVFTSSLSRAADPNALYVVVAGGNDLRDARTAHGGTDAAAAAARSASAAEAARNVVNSLGLLAQAGARHFLIASMPDLGGTPEAVDLNAVAASTDVTVKFNAALGLFAGGFDQQFLALTGVDLDIREVDLFAVGAAVVDDARNNGGQRYGITNISTPCINPLVAPNGAKFYFVPGTTTTDCAHSSNSDDLHPSAALHRLIGQAALDVALPEPASLALLAFAMVSLMLVTRRRRG